jgi:hypothetical protein
MRDAELVDTAERIGRRRSRVRKPAWTRKFLGRDLDRTLDHPNQVGVQALQPISYSFLRRSPFGRYPMMQTTTPVPVEGGALRVAHCP